MYRQHTWSGPRLAVIPARGGSRRLPGKNIRYLSGKPLIGYTIEAALNSGLFDCVVVSTDSEEIAEIARKFGADVPFLRDESLADDHTPVSVVTVDTLERLDPEGKKFAHVAQLMANCPLRTGEDIRNSYRQFVLTGTDSQISVTQFGWQNPWWAMERNEAFQLQPLFDGRVTQRSQDLPELLCPTGAVWWAKTSSLRRYRTYHIENRTGWIIPWHRAVDIDTEEDWEVAELLVRAWGLMGSESRYAG
jgi:N-acylneuraminate cytidylyltransferase